MQIMDIDFDDIDVGDEDLEDNNDIFLNSKKVKSKLIISMFIFNYIYIIHSFIETFIKYFIYK